MYPAAYLQGSYNLQPANQTNYLQPTATAQQLQPTLKVDSFQNTYDPMNAAPGSTLVNGQVQAPAATGAVSAATTPTSASGGGSGSGGVDPNLLNRMYDTRISNLRSIFDTLDPQQQMASLNINNQWQNNRNNLEVQRAQGDRNLNDARTKVTEGQVRGIADLNRQVETMGRSYQNQLGGYGAGDSSAAQMLNQALGGMASKNRAGVVRNASDQQQGINVQAQDMQVEYDNGIRQLDDWKAQTLQQIASDFLTKRQAIQQQMATADQDRYMQLAQQDASYVQRAMQALAQTEQMFKQQSTDLISQYQQMASPNVNINPQLQQFAVQPIDAGRLQQLRMTPDASNGNQPAQTYDPRLFRDRTNGTANFLV